MNFQKLCKFQVPQNPDLFLLLHVNIENPSDLIKSFSRLSPSPLLSPETYSKSSSYLALIICCYFLLSFPTSSVADFKCLFTLLLENKLAKIKTQQSTPIVCKTKSDSPTLLPAPAMTCFHSIPAHLSLTISLIYAQHYFTAWSSFSTASIFMYLAPPPVMCIPVFLVRLPSIHFSRLIVQEHLFFD